LFTCTEGAQWLYSLAILSGQRTWTRLCTLRPCSFDPKTIGIEEDWKELEKILTCRGFNPPQSLWINTKRTGPHGDSETRLVFGDIQQCQRVHRKFLQNSIKVPFLQVNIIPHLTIYPDEQVSPAALFPWFIWGTWHHLFSLSFHHQYLQTNCLFWCQNTTILECVLPCST
jgi:hypothetical protein